MLKNKFFRSKWIAAGWFITITCLFFIKVPPVKKGGWFTDFHGDKLVHLAFFATLFFLWRSAFTWQVKSYNLKLFLATVIYGLLIEVLQGWLVVNRYFDFFDLVADAAGSLVGLWVWFRIYKQNNDSELSSGRI